MGDMWTQDGCWNSQVETTIDGYENIHTPAEAFPRCLKHKSVLIRAAAHSGKNIHTEATANGKRYELDAKQNDPINGIRYLWFAKGIGLVKMRYERTNGFTTEAELFEYRVPAGKIEESLPLQIGSMYTYKYHNIYRNETMTETWRVTESF